VNEEVLARGGTVAPKTKRSTHNLAIMIIRTYLQVQEQGGRRSLLIRVFITPPTERLQNKDVCP